MATYVDSNLNDPSLFFEAVTYTGNTSSGTTNNDLSFQPDMVWFKSRTQTENHQIYDAVRGTTKRIIPNGTQTEATASTGLTSFDSDGFTTGGEQETDSGNIVAWCWKANGAGSSNSVGDLTVTTSANTTSGLSIIKGTSDSTADRTIGHGLGTVPDAILTKNLDSGYNWDCYFRALGYNASLILNSTAATRSGAWGSSTFTTTLFQTKNTYSSNNGDEYVYYVISSRQGFSKVGSYIGNNGGSDGVFVYTGFRPKLVIQKLSSSSGANWIMRDTARDTYNPMDNQIEANTSDAKEDNHAIDFLSNGFKTRANGLNQQDSGETYIYMAFAEAPFVNSNGVPCNAR